MTILRVSPTALKIRKILKTLQTPKEQCKSSSTQKSQNHFIFVRATKYITSLKLKSFK